MPRLMSPRVPMRGTLHKGARERDARMCVRCTGPDLGVTTLRRKMKSSLPTKSNDEQQVDEGLRAPFRSLSNMSAGLCERVTTPRATSYICRLYRGIRGKDDDFECNARDVRQR